MKPLTLPALHGRMGERPYYACVVSLSEIAQRVSYASEIHPSKQMSEFIQRRLVLSRADDIARYLVGNPERFFSSLVVAMYEGDPLWYDAGTITFSEGVDPKPRLPDDISKRLGFLHLSGAERLFALDGQHRLAGIRKAVKQDAGVADDLIAVLFVGHRNTNEGQIKTRRLFTTLNKHAKPVHKADIIALDEDDASAIITRRLVEGGLFASGSVSFTASNQLAETDRRSFTTIVALYDAVRVLAEHMPHPDHAMVVKARKERARPSDDVLNRTCLAVEGFFKKLVEAFDDLKTYFALPEKKKRVGKSRTRKGGHVLFRPVGFGIFVQLIVDLLEASKTLPQALALASALPTDLSQDPYRRILWLPESQRMDVRQERVVLDLLRLALDVHVTEKRLKVITASVNDAYGFPFGSPEFLAPEGVRQFAKSLV